MTVQPIEHIVKTPEVVGGSARIAGRRIAVYQIAFLHEWEGAPVGDLAEQFALTPAQVHAALAYYHDNQAEVLREIQAVELCGPPPDHRPCVDDVLERWQAQTGYNPNEELTVAQVADEYGISPQAVREACAKGWIVGRKSGTIWLIRRLSAHNRWG